jgi:hypothetical protein
MEEKNEKVVEETTQEQTEETPQIDESKFESVGDDSVIKVDLSKPPIPKEEKNETKEDNADDSGVVAESEDTDSPQKQEEVQPEAETQETPVLEEISEEEVEEKVEEIAEEAEEAIKENIETGKPLPENIQKLVDFMEETGGTLEDYVKINQDYTKLDDDSLLREYYRQTKKHLNEEEINFLMEDQFSYSEDEDDERDIRRKKLALKEQVASAKSHLDGQKSKYYEEIKAGSKLTPEQQKAMDFFNRYNKESEENQKIAEASKSTFLKKTDQVFNNNFKGFEYNVGDKKFRFNVKDANKVKETQSDINNFVKKFLNKQNTMEDAKGYHKSLYTAMNADAIAKHFYEQGKADAMKDSVAKAKNVNMNPRQSHGEVKTGGLKFKVLGDNSSDFKFKIKNRNK